MKYVVVPKVVSSSEMLEIINQKLDKIIEKLDEKPINNLIETY